MKQTSSCLPAADGQLSAADVARGVCRLLYHGDHMPLCEVPLGNGRRADVIGLGDKRQITLVEIKISMADLRADIKWREYLEYCDRFCWAVPAGFPLDVFDDPLFLPGRAGLMVADRYGAALLREPAMHPLNASRRKAEQLRFARRAARRLLGVTDPTTGQ